MFLVFLKTINMNFLGTCVVGRKQILGGIVKVHAGLDTTIVKIDKHYFFLDNKSTFCFCLFGFLVGYLCCGSE